MKELGSLRKLQLTYQTVEPIHYALPVGEACIPLNELLGETILLEFKKDIFCIHCGKKTGKSFNQGYCFPCFRSLARCDICIVKPELCHFHKNTCREPEWGQSHCMIPHTIYLANSSGLKIGITRSHQQTTRWMDQGAVAALPIARVTSRLAAGKIEVAIKKTIADKTNWRVMLKGEIPELDLQAEKTRLKKLIPTKIEHEWLEEETVMIHYPVLEYPQKISSLNLEKTPKIKGKLLGLKGQYIILDSGVMNIRKYAGYQVQFEA
ncbi:MAG: DUF2797 domain-containing protein [Oligoflexus sp.]